VSTATRNYVFTIKEKAHRYHWSLENPFVYQRLSSEREGVLLFTFLIKFIKRAIGGAVKRFLGCISLEYIHF
jgi:hypothetical protein